MTTSLTKSGLIHYFWRSGNEVRSLEALSKSLDDVLAQKLDAKELALVLYHATKDSINGVYGEDIKAAQAAIENRIQKWTDKSLKAYENFTPFTLAQMLTSLKLLNLRPPERFVEFAMTKAEKLIPEFNADDMNFSLSAFAYLSIPLPKKIIQAIEKRMPAIQQTFSSDQAYNVLWSLAVIDAVNKHHNPQEKLSLSGAYNALIKDQLIRQKLASSNKKSFHNMLSDSLLWFKGDTEIERSQEEDTSSLFELDVKVELEKAGAIILPSYELKKPKHKVDISAKFNNASILFECDGPTHFVRSADDFKVYLNGKTLFQTALIFRNIKSSSIIRIPSDVYYQHMGDTDFWGNLLLEIDDKELGAYILGQYGLQALPAGREPAAPENN